MAFGDSMTVGVIAVRAPQPLLVPSPTSYPGRLQVLLSERYTTQTPTVDDQGLTGESAQDAVPRLRSALRSTQPEVVLLLEGANDLNFGGPSAVAPTDQAMEAMAVASLADTFFAAIKATLEVVPTAPGARSPVRR
jgi:lysophospholipase L1-like esterase